MADDHRPRSARSGQRQGPGIPARQRGLSSNRPANGISEPGRAGLPPSTGRMRVGVWGGCGAMRSCRFGYCERVTGGSAVVLDFVAGQLEVADPSVVKRYTERAKTKLDHQWEIRRVHGLTGFSAAEAELREWVSARSWTSGNGPKAIF